MKVLIKIGKFFVFLIGLATIILVSVIWIMYATKSGDLDFLKDTGPIGDTVGGLTAPIIGLIGSILVYVSFNAQRKANQLQIDALEEERKRYEIDRWYNNKKNTLDDIKKSYKNLEICFPNDTTHACSPSEHTIYKGTHANILFTSFISDLNNTSTTKEVKASLGTYQLDLYYVLEEMLTLIDEVHIYKDVYPIECLDINHDISVFYELYLIATLDDIIPHVTADFKKYCEDLKIVLDNLENFETEN